MSHFVAAIENGLVGNHRIEMDWRLKVHLVTHAKEYYGWECDWNSFLLSDFAIEHHDDPERSYVGENAILVVSSSGPNQGEENTRSQLRRFREAGIPVGLIHLSDEWQQAPIDFYKDAAFMFRNCYRPEAHRDGRCHHFALGWKAGFRDSLVERSIDQRSLRWSFAGMTKSSRLSMLRGAEKITGGKHIVTTGFGGEGGGIPVREYAGMLNDTVFALCPRGNYSVDCFRVWEALEAGAIPIVEDDGGSDLLGEWLKPANFMRIGGWRRSYWKYHFRNPLRGSFWKTAYGDDFPCPRIINWATLPSLIHSIDVERTSAAVRSWWAQYKISLRKLFRETIEKTFCERETDLASRLDLTAAANR